MNSFLPWIKKDPNEIQSQKHLQTVLQQQYKDLGPLSWQEGTIAILFVIMVGLWITRDFSNHPGWEVIFRKEFVDLSKHLIHLKVSFSFLFLVLLRMEQLLYSSDHYH